ncbi:MAG: response regulator transcription factor [Vicinamibacterales bacterium]
MSARTMVGTSALVHEVLVVEDEPEMRDLLADNLEFEGYRVASVGSAEEAMQRIEQRVFAVIVLDIMLPGASGYELCRRIRERGARIPIIMLSAKNDESDRVLGLDLGADDYVSKPFSVRELLARVRAQVRRDGGPKETESGELNVGEIQVNLRTRLVRRRNKVIELSPHEFELLRYFIAHRGEVVSREQLLRDVWGYSQLSVTRTVDNYVFRLRNHLEPKPHDPRHILTVHGSGYRLVL